MIRFTSILSALAALAISMACAAQAPAIDTVSPSSMISGEPMPTITITGFNLVVGLPSPTNQPTVTLSHTGGKAEYSTLAFVNFSGTLATIPAGDLNLLQAPLGWYDLTVTRPDGATATNAEAFRIIAEDNKGPIELEIATYWGGPITGMDISTDGTLAYIANGRMLRILDISDESNPAEVGSLAYPQGVRDVKVRDGYAFVCGNPRLTVVDVSDPTSPELVSVSPPSSGGSADQVELWGEYAYVGGVSVTIFNIGDPLNVVAHGSITGARSMAIHGDRLYVGKRSSTGAAPLRIFDLAANPVNPPLIGTLDWNDVEEVSAIAVNGEHVYVGQKNQSGSASALATIDVSNPQSPVLMDIMYEFYHAESMAVIGDHLFIAERNNGAGNPPSATKGMVVLDISSNPAAPAIVASYKCQTSSVPYGLRADSNTNRIYLFEQAEGLIVLDVSNPTEPVRLGRYHSPSTLKQMVKSGDQLFVADWYGGFTILDVSNPSSPVVTGTYQADTWDDIGFAVEGLAVQDGVAFVSLRNRGLDAVDVSDLSNPTLISNLFPPLPNWGNTSYLGGVTVSGDVAHLGFFDRITVSGSATRHLTVDVSDVKSMFEIGRSENLGVGDPADCILLHSSGTAFTADDSYGAKMIDVTNPATPHQVGEIAGIVELDLALVDDTLFLASHPPVPYNRGLHIFDVSDPMNPLALAHIHEDNPVPGPGGSFNSAWAVDVQNGRAYVAAQGLSLLDVSDPANPIGLAFADAGGGSLQFVLASEPQVFLVNSSLVSGANGLTILNIHGLPEAEPDCLADIVSSATFQPPPDGIVDGADLAYLLGEWGRNKGSLADLVTSATFQPPPDGVVDAADLAYLLGAWGTCD